MKVLWYADSSVAQITETRLLI